MINQQREKSGCSLASLREICIEAGCTCLIRDGMQYIYVSVVQPDHFKSDGYVPISAMIFFFKSVFEVISQGKTV